MFYAPIRKVVGPHADVVQVIEAHSRDTPFANQSETESALLRAITSSTNVFLERRSAETVCNPYTPC